MNKKLLPIILVLVMASIAVAGDMDYTVYGKLHMSTQMNNDSEDSQIALSSNTSRFGLKGSQALTDDYKLIWQFEQALDLANRGGSLATRNSFLGFKSDLGTWLVGIHDTPMKNLGRKTTFFFDTVGDFRSTTMGWDQRYSDIIMYQTPKMDSFSGQLMYRFDQNDAGAQEADNIIGAMAAYHNGGFMLGVAYELASKGHYPTVATTTDTTYSEIDHDANPSTDPIYLPVITTTEETSYGEAASAIRVAAKYMGDKFGVSGLFQTVSNADGVDGKSQQTYGGEALFKASDQYHVKANFYMADPDTDVEDNEYSQMALGIDRVYESVTVYLQFAMMMNGDASARGLGGNGWGDSVAAFAAGESPMSVSAGFWTKF